MAGWDDETAVAPDVPEAPGYTLVEPLGSGGMGDVYRARQARTGREVAVKILRGSVVEAEPAQRLLAEASAIARLRHKNVVELLDLTRTRDGRPMIVLELVDGGDLTGWERRFPGWGAIRRAVTGVLDGLAAAHGAQLVHADLKPSNLLLSRDGVVKISDFGIARWQDPLHRSDGPRSISGTPEYMAPEQLLPDGHVGPWTDLYALGVMLHEWLGGRTPFVACDDLPSLMRRKLTLEPPPIVPRAGLTIPDEVQRLAQQLLALEPRERPRFAAQLRQALEASLPEPSSDHARGAPAVSWSPSAHDPSLALPTTLPLIGRRAERRLLENQVEAVHASARPRLVLLRGPAGIGKSHLALWAFGEVERRGWMEGLAAGFDFEGGAHGDGLRHAMRRLLGVPDGRGDPFEGSWRWLLDGPVAPFPAREVLGWIRADRGFTSPERSGELAALILRAASRVRPVYLWLDDLLWSRDGAAELVDRLLEAGDAGVLVVGTVRSGTADHASARKRLDRWLAHSSTSYIALGPLSVEERVELARAALPLDPEFAREVGRELDDMTPLELVQSLAHWHERGWLEGDPGALRPAASHTLSSLRLSTRDLFDARLRAILHRTPDVMERALVTAALLGDPFEAEVLRASLPDAPEVVDEAIAWALLRGLWRSMPGGAMRFDHGLLRTASLDLLMHRPDASRLSAQAARGIAAVHDVAVPAFGRRVSELWLAAGEDAEATATLLRTGRAVAQAGALERARDLHRGIAEWVERARDPRARVDHRLLAATIELHAGRHSRAAEGAAEAIASARELGDHDRLAEAQLLAATVAFGRASYAEGEALAASLRAIEGGASPGRARVAVQAEGLLADLAALREDFARVAVHYARAEPWLGPAQDRALTHRWLARGAELALIEGDPDRAAERLGRAIEGTRGDGDTDDLPDLMEIATRVRWARGEHAEAAREAQARVLEVRALGDATRLTGARVTLALAVAAGGEPRATAEAIEALLEAQADAPRERAFEIWALGWLAARLRDLDLTEFGAELEGVIHARRRRVHEGSRRPTTIT